MVSTFLVLHLLAPLAAAQITSVPITSDVVTVQIFDKQVQAFIQVGGVYEVRLVLEFENVLGLHSDALKISARLIDPLDPSLLQRLPGGALASVPSQFPVMLSVSPDPQSRLSFTGTVSVDLSTPNLLFDTSLRLFKAPSGGVFEDITSFTGVGSYRAGGMSGEFSDFLIAADVRDVHTVVQSKFDRLQQTLQAHSSSITGQTFEKLQGKLDAARSSYQLGLVSEAVSHLEAFDSTIRADEGETIPNIFRANDSGTKNVAGILRSQARTLIFSLKTI